jgi:hypothetical protein
MIFYFYKSKCICLSLLESYLGLNSNTFFSLLLKELKFDKYDLLNSFSISSNSFKVQYYLIISADNHTVKTIFKFF